MYLILREREEQAQTKNLVLRGDRGMAWQYLFFHCHRHHPRFVFCPARFQSSLYISFGFQRKFFFIPTNNIKTLVSY